MADIKLHSRKDAITILYNNLMQELVTTEFNIQGLEKQKLMSMTIDPQLNQVLKNNKEQASKIQASLAIVYEMLMKEDKETKVRGTN